VFEYLEHLGFFMVQLFFAIFWAANTLLVLFVAFPKAFLPSVRGVTGWTFPLALLLSATLWIVVPSIAVFSAGFFLQMLNPDLVYWLATSWGNFGFIAGVVIFVLNYAFSAKTRSTSSEEFAERAARYLRVSE
jgi:hypothetical protein